MLHVYAVVLGDSACVGFEGSVFADKRSFWGDLTDGEEWVIVRFDLEADTLPESEGDPYKDTTMLLSMCASWEVVRYGDKPYCDPFVVWDGVCAWCASNPAGDVLEVVWSPHPWNCHYIPSKLPPWED